MASKHLKRSVEIDGSQFHYSYYEQKSNYLISAPGLNEFQVLTLEKADKIITSAVRIKRRIKG